MIDHEATVKRFKGFIRVSLNNESINLHLKRRKDSERETPCEDITLYLSKEALFDNYDFLENSVRVLDFEMVIKNDILYEIMSSWEQKQRDIIYLSLCEKWSKRKIGSIFNMPRSTVQYIKQQLCKELKAKLGGDKYVERAAGSHQACRSGENISNTDCHDARWRFQK